MAMEKTYLMVKPDGVQRGLVGEIVSRFEKKGLKLVAAKLMIIPKEVAENHYGEHKGKPFFEGLVDFMTSGPIYAAVLEKENAVPEWRKLMGATDPAKAEEGTIRKKYAESVQHNAVHGSDSDENALNEIFFFFSAREIVNAGGDIYQLHDMSK